MNFLFAADLEGVEDNSVLLLQDEPLQPDMIMIPAYIQNIDQGFDI